MDSKKAKFKSWPELFIGLTIIGLTALVGVVLVGHISAKARDGERKEMINSFYAAAKLFNSDYGFYPNYTMTLGLNLENPDKLYNYDLASAISLCVSNEGYSNPEFFAVGVDLETAEPDINKAVLKPGFKAVGGFLVCLGYMQDVPSDPIWSGTVSDYRYRVSADAQDIVVETVIERGNTETTYYQPELIAVPALYDFSDAFLVDDGSYFEAFKDRKTNNGKYLYQCLQKADGTSLTVQERVSEEYMPFVKNKDSLVAPNTACKDSLDGLLTVKAN